MKMGRRTSWIALGIVGVVALAGGCVMQSGLFPDGTPPTIDDTGQPDLLVDTVPLPNHRYLRVVQDLVSGGVPVTVTSDPVGIACPPTCGAWFSEGTAVELTRADTANRCISSVHWSGEQCVGNGACNVVMDEDREVSLVITQDSDVAWLLTVGGNGDAETREGGLAVRGKTVALAGTWEGLTDFGDGSRVSDGRDGFVASYYLENGALDFAIDYVGPVSGADDFARAAAIDPVSGRVLATGTLDTDVFLGFEAEDPRLSGFETFTGGGAKEIRGLDVDPEGAVVLAGYGQFQSLDLDPFSVMGATGAGSDVFVSRLVFDELGGLAAGTWARQFGSNQTDEARGVAIDPESQNIFVAGYHDGFMNFGLDPGGSLLTLPAPGNNADRALVFALNPAGQILWAESFGGESQVRFHNVAIDRDGYLVLVGIFYGQVVIDGTEHTNLNIGNGLYDSLIIKLDPVTGDVIWSKSIQADGDDRLYDIAFDDENRILVAGFFSGTVTLDDVGPVASTGGTTDAYVARLTNPDVGNTPHVEWAWSLRTQGDGRSYGVEFMADSAVLMGYFEGNGVDNFVSCGSVSATQQDVFLTRLALP